MDPSSAYVFLIRFTGLTIQVLFYVLFSITTIFVVTRIILRRFFTVRTLYPEDILIILAWVKCKSVLSDK
jgi:hypothetical protein